MEEKLLHSMLHANTWYPMYWVLTPSIFNDSNRFKCYSDTFEFNIENKDDNDGEQLIDEMKSLNRMRADGYRHLLDTKTFSDHGNQRKEKQQDEVYDKIKTDFKYELYGKI